MDDISYSLNTSDAEISFNLSVNPKRKSQFPGDVETLMKK